MQCPFDIINDAEGATEDAITPEEWHDMAQQCLYAPNRYPEQWVQAHNLRHVNQYLQDVFAEWPSNITL